MTKTTQMRQFGERLKALRRVAGYENAEEFATALGVEAPRYRRYERGDAWPPLDLLVEMAKLTNTTLDFLLLGKK